MLGRATILKPISTTLGELAAGTYFFTKTGSLCLMVNQGEHPMERRRVVNLEYGTISEPIVDAGCDRLDDKVWLADVQIRAHFPTPL